MLLSAAAIAVAAGAASQAGAKDFTFSSYLPPKHAVNVYGMEPMFKAFEPEVTWKLLAGGQLFSAQNTLKGIGNRTADGGGAVVITYTRAELKHINIVGDLMMLADNEYAMNGAALEMILLNDCPGCREDFAKHNVVYLSGYGVGDYSLLCNKKVTDLPDVKGRKVRTTGAMGRWAKAMGGTPVNMTSGDMVEAISRGQIDCIMGPVAWLKAYSMEDSVKYIYDYKFGSLAAVGLFSVNRAAWNEHTPAQKKKIVDSQAEAVARTMVLGYSGDDQRVRLIAKERGITITPAQGNLRKLWEDHNKGEIDLTIQNAEKIGVKDARPIVDTFLAKLKRWNEQVAKSGLREKVAAAGADEAKLTEASRIYQRLLQENIYGKVDPSKL